MVYKRIKPSRLFGLHPQLFMLCSCGTTSDSIIIAWRAHMALWELHPRVSRYTSTIVNLDNPTLMQAAINHYSDLQSKVVNKPKRSIAEIRAFSLNKFLQTCTPSVQRTQQRTAKSPSIANSNLLAHLFCTVSACVPYGVIYVHWWWQSKFIWSV